MRANSGEAMQLFAQFQKEIISLAFTLVAAGLLYFFRARAKLVWGTPYGFTFLVQDVPAPTPTLAPTDAPPTPTPVATPAPTASNIQTAQLIVQNSGRETTTEIEVTFNWQPYIHNIWPSRPYDIHTATTNGSH